MGRGRKERGHARNCTAQLQLPGSGQSQLPGLDSCSCHSRGSLPSILEHSDALSGLSGLGEVRMCVSFKVTTSFSLGVRTSGSSLFILASGSWPE